MTIHSAKHDESSRQFDIALSNRQSRQPVNDEQLCDAVRAVLRDSTFTSATISIAVVDDSSIRELNRRYLDHDWPTDVLSFVLDERADHLEGEVIISADTAATAAAEAGWPAAAELLLYVIHGTLHLIGYGDKSPADARRMRAAEEKYLGQLGFQTSQSNDNSAGPDILAANRARGGATAR